MTDFTELLDLASERLGGAVLYANDDFFAEKENLLKPTKAIFIDGKYTDRGKWMDGWESRRRRVPGHDFCIVRLGIPGVIRGVIVDTAHFKGNYPQACSIEACAIDGQPTAEELQSPSIQWTEILPKTDLKGDFPNSFALKSGARFTHLRFHIYPDGGVARLRVHGDVAPDARWMGRAGVPVDLAAAEHGALVIGANDMFFGSRNNLIMPGRSVNMGDGWETKRSRKEAPDYCIVRLATEGSIERIEVDTNHFKGNFPESTQIHGLIAPANASFESLLKNESAWSEILPRTKLQAHTRHFYDREIKSAGPFTHVRVRIYPDGGVSRLRLHGPASNSGREQVLLRMHNLGSDARQTEALTTCLASPKWAKAMLAARPFRDLAAMKKASREAAATLTRKDWLQAFAAHPRIGEKPKGASTHLTWARGEQEKVHAAPSATLEKLKKINRAYERKFGFVYLVCATGKSAEELLAIAQSRIDAAPKTEFARACEEQIKITDLRLEKMLRG